MLSGAFSTIIGSFLARMRGTSEPDLSKSRAKGYERFLRACEAFVVDSGDEPAREHIDRINAFRQEFEELEGSANACVLFLSLSSPSSLLAVPSQLPFAR